mmetsp:Transcript_40315/g.95768  ORF Transcript_40315/g.95768 Transcript_40315/m.95768 type:complete len:509 (-) Transcript_40315:250-1776(-)|eukprot:CAMPEP_0177715878 /NCGR_PEP_ID=MMETSP0484_2-20121128/14225_1 /TAXON_ID=354590 /ORGANISM="Rhodomonas lens, Strain RHODO" /LENGTH=508 /DNA_ID=CAMNT_0019227899 /DNA_START=48 /DNA_END=1574 /DNA_ORIENTATION=+
MAISRVLVAVICLCLMHTCDSFNSAFSLVKTAGIQSRFEGQGRLLLRQQPRGARKQPSLSSLSMLEVDSEVKYFNSIASALSSSRAELALDKDEVWVDLGKHVGAGTYGDVFEAVIVDGPRKGTRAIAKRAKTKVFNPELLAGGGEQKGTTAAQLQQAWHENDEYLWEAAPAFLKVESYINQRCAALCPKVMAPYLGTVEQQGSQWLLWEHVGAVQTLEHMLQTCAEAGSLKPLAMGLGVRSFEEGDPEHMRHVVNEAARQMLVCCTELQRAGIAHRDIKPANLLVAHHQMLLIDFGSAAVMGDFPMIGYNYSEAPCDIKYCPPERFIDELEWTKYDIYCVALILLRVLMPPLLQEGGYEQFRDAFQDVDNDIDAWFANLILQDPMIQTVQGKNRAELPDWGLPRLSDRIQEYERLADLSCELHYDDETGALSKAQLGLCALKEGLAALSNNHLDGLVWDLLHAMLEPEPSLRPRADEALQALGGDRARWGGERLRESSSSQSSDASS